MEDRVLGGNELLLSLLLCKQNIISAATLCSSAYPKCDPAAIAIAEVLDAAAATDSTTTDPRIVAVNGAICSFSEAHDNLPILWEGAAQPRGILGAAGLAPLLVEAAQSVLGSSSPGKIAQDSSMHFVMDAGTGCTAAAVAAQLCISRAAATLSPRQVFLHVVLVAGSAIGFKHMLHHAAQVLAPEEKAILQGVCITDCTSESTPRALWVALVEEQQTQSCTFTPPLQLILHKPCTARSFGAVNSTVALASVQLARRTGMLCDPIYTSKLLLTLSGLQADLSAGRSGTSTHWLAVHGGGGSGLLGHAQALSKAVHQTNNAIVSEKD
jgi:hypothetical protein